MATYLIVSEKNWHKELYDKVCEIFPSHNFVLINKKEEFTFEKIRNYNPEKIFIPHWSYLIEEKLFEAYDCIIFHMTDLPFGRGGSPLQNLILRGIKETKISALKVNGEVDGGDIYLKYDLNLSGTAQEIFLRASSIIGTMIEDIIINNPESKPQTGEQTLFKRRKPVDSRIEQTNSIEAVYDFIRMLDADGYPNAFLEIGDLKLEFSRATIKSNSEILADVRISKK